MVLLLCVYKTRSTGVIPIRLQADTAKAAPLEEPSEAVSVLTDQSLIANSKKRTTTMASSLRSITIRHMRGVTVRRARRLRCSRRRWSASRKSERLYARAEIRTRPYISLTEYSIRPRFVYALWYLCCAQHKYHYVASELCCVQKFFRGIPKEFAIPTSRYAT